MLLGMQQNNKIGRNYECPCGSGKKYKNCCLNSKTVKPSLPQDRKKPKPSFTAEGKQAVKVNPEFPPSWLEKEFENIKSQLLNTKHLENFWESYKSLNKIFDTFPSFILYNPLNPPAHSIPSLSYFKALIPLIQFAGIIIPSFEEIV